jgi:hypothetical protein
MAPAAIMLTSLFVGYISASFLFSCMGWRWLLFDRPRPLHPPSLTGPALLFGGGAYGLVWQIGCLVRRPIKDRERTPRDLLVLVKSEIWFCMNLLGWCNTLFIGLWCLGLGLGMGVKDVL